MTDNHHQCPDCDRTARMDRTLDLAFTIGAVVTIILSLASAAYSIYTGELGPLVWQILTAVGFGTALMQSKRANRVEAGR